MYPDVSWAAVPRARPLRMVALSPFCELGYLYGGGVLALTQVAEAYFHLKRVKLSLNKLEELGDLTATLAAEAANSLYPPDSIIEVRLAEGSLKGWASVTIAGMLSVYGFVANYKGFKEGVFEMTADAKRFGDAVIERFADRSNLPGAYVYRKERRTKTPGRIKRLIDKREWLEAHKAQLPRAVVEEQSIEIERLLQLILADLEPSERAALRSALQEDEPVFPVHDEMRVALPIRRTEQFSMFDGASGPEQVQLPDYLRRFRLSDGPRLAAPDLQRGQLLLPPPE